MVITKRKIAIGLCIVDVIHQEKIWHDFILDSKNSKDFELVFLINQKNDDVSLKLLDEYKIVDPIISDWGTLGIVRVASHLINKVMEDPLVERFIFLSESCIPIKPFDYIAHHLDPNFSYFSLFPDEDNLKSTMWYVLNRKHAMICAEEALEWRQTSLHADECLFITCLKDKGFGREIIETKKLRDEGIVFVPWRFSPDFKVYRGTIIYAVGQFHTNPLNYYRIAEKEFVDLIVHKPCMFARKFSSEAKVLKLNGEEVPLENYLPFVKT